MISIRMSDKAENELKEIAAFEGLSVSEYVRNLINEKLEDVYDLRIGEDALLKYENDPITYTMDEVFGDNK